MIISNMVESQYFEGSERASAYFSVFSLLPVLLGSEEALLFF